MQQNTKPSGDQGVGDVSSPIVMTLVQNSRNPSHAKVTLIKAERAKVRIHPRLKSLKPHSAMRS
jgi:hypothetical protein